MRTFAGTLLFEDIFEYIPSTEPELYNLSLTLFNPNILLVENDCKTTLGKFEIVNYEAEGLTELATETRISYDRINQLLSTGVYIVATRHTSTCISKNGVCKKCFMATYPNSNVNTLDRVDVVSEYLTNAEIVEVSPEVLTYQTKTDPDTYKKAYVFHKGLLMISGNDYTLSSTGNFTLTKPVDTAGNIVIRFMKEDRRAFLGWLASTYSGSILGMKPIPHELLPLRPLFLASTLLENRLQSISEIIKSSKSIPKDYSGYIDLINDPLEKALYMLTIFSIYYNVSS
jgi:hypothetical protein